MDTNLRIKRKEIYFMSSGTNQERITQNNAKLAQLKIKADNLPGA